jgi:hypothetical protein
MIETWKAIRAGHIVRMVKRSVKRILVGKTKRTRPLFKSKRRYNDDIFRDFKGVE